MLRSWLAFAVVLFSFGGARADALRVDASDERMRVDGSLREWGDARFAVLGSGDDAALRYALASGDGGLYLGVEVTDQRLVRSPSVGAGQDALVLTVAMPNIRGGFDGVEIWLHAGEVGKSKAAAALGSARRAPRAEGLIRVVEGPLDKGAGYVVEAFVPWSLVPGAEIWEQGRAALRFDDVDSERGGVVEATLASATASQPAELPRFGLGNGQRDFLGVLAKSQHLTGIEPRYDFRGDVYGDRAPERVILLDRFVLVYGPHYKDGEAFGYHKLPIAEAGGLKSAELRDLTGDGRAELVLTLRQENDLGARDLFMVLALDGDDPRPVWSVETRKEAQGGFVEAKLSLEDESKGALRIRVEPGRAQGLDASSYREARANDAVSILLPWGDALYRVYRFDGSRFAVVEEKKRESSAPVISSQQPRSGGEPSREPEITRVEPSVAAVLALVKKEQGIAARQRPSRHQHANLCAGAREEQLFVFGTKLVVLGGDLGDGGGYLVYALPVSAPEDFLYVGTADVTRDLTREIFVRVKQALVRQFGTSFRVPNSSDSGGVAAARPGTPPFAEGAEGVHRELALVLRCDELGRFGLALALDVTRRQGERVVANRVVTRGGALVVTPGEAHGWSAADYPFTNEPVGGVERLLLPWTDSSVRYLFENGRFVSAAARTRE